VSLWAVNLSPLIYHRQALIRLRIGSLPLSQARYSLIPAGQPLRPSKNPFSEVELDIVHADTLDPLLRHDDALAAQERERKTDMEIQSKENAHSAMTETRPVLALHLLNRN
jgi:hypothetical protein